MVDLKLKRHRASPRSASQPWAFALLVLLSGVLMSFAAPPFGLWPLAWFSLAPLWVIVITQRSWQAAFLYGVIWGVGFYGSVLSWITYLHPLTWMGVPWLGSLAIAAFAWSFVTLWGAVTVGLWAIGLHFLYQLKGHSVSFRIWGGTALWCLLEVLRNQTPLDWSSLALTQSPNNLWVLQLSQVSGQLLVAAVLVGFNALLAEAYGVLTKSNIEAKLRPLMVSALILFLSAHGVGAILFARSPEPDPSQALKVGLIQGNIPTRVKLTPVGIRHALENYLNGYTQLVAEGADAVLTPEGAIPDIWDARTAQANPLIEAVKATGVPLWLGTFATDPQHPDLSHVTQSLLEINRQGEVTSRYNKIQLVPLGEYLPLRSLLGQLIGRLSPLDSYLVPGNADQQFITHWGPAIVGICYESAYGRLFREQARRGGEFILTASNNDPYPPRMMAQHHALDVIRAIESDRWAVRATNTGISGLVTPQGQTHWLARPSTYTTHLTTIYRRQTRTLYTRWGNWILPALISTSVMIALLQRKAQRLETTSHER